MMLKLVYHRKINRKIIDMVQIEMVTHTNLRNKYQKEKVSYSDTFSTNLENITAQLNTRIVIIIVITKTDIN
jgi:hypothetical protein